MKQNVKDFLWGFITIPTIIIIIALVISWRGL